MNDKIRLVFVGGGVRSGKSTFAVELGLQLGNRRLFVATATPSDEEMEVRIARHKKERAEAFATVEAPIALPEVIESAADVDVVVVDCLTLWLSNLLLRGDSADAVLAQVDRLVSALLRRRFHAVVVTNEVGMSVHPPSAIARAFVDVCGWAHQRVSRAVDEIYLAVLGTVVPIRGPAAEAGPAWSKRS